jgi:hypothetical protein
MTRWPNTWLVAPQRSRLASSVQSRRPAAGRRWRWCGVVEGEIELVGGVGDLADDLVPDELWALVGPLLPIPAWAAAVAVGELGVRRAIGLAAAVIRADRACEAVAAALDSTRCRSAG